MSFSFLIREMGREVATGRSSLWGFYEGYMRQCGKAWSMKPWCEALHTVGRRQRPSRALFGRQGPEARVKLQPLMFLPG